MIPETAEEIKSGSCVTCWLIIWRKSCTEMSCRLVQRVGKDEGLVEGFCDGLGGLNPRTIAFASEDKESYAVCSEGERLYHLSRPMDGPNLLGEDLG